MLKRVVFVGVDYVFDFVEGFGKVFRGIIVLCGLYLSVK